MSKELLELLHSVVREHSDIDIPALHDRILEMTGVERLRVALQQITTDPPATLDEPDTDCEVIQKMRLIARDALS